MGIFTFTEECGALAKAKANILSVFERRIFFFVFSNSFIGSITGGVVHVTTNACSVTKRRRELE